ncbi:uncharacterized protein Z518_10996 [Rhinocladiella mackenziei CBS 650.93]|uniref:S1-like domain-containing protein n=1 Tax=Rhinocladiella mackenziei CBS 650.93 TaxID=1442369 RepID=A0A0D2I2U8_9EURO|nr:uncharacterized protein Z518_10996 [Rhinocladiella mackenziei CBS 650.93]KIX00069.1 hypothetical protein Z518_10996 [Rhinocladiella mackenziei CBS 650.93]
MARNRKPVNRHRRLAEEILTPPASLTPDQTIARILNANGKDLYTVQTPGSTTLLVELEVRFRGVIFVRRGGYVLVDTSPVSERTNKIQGLIVNVIGDESRWRKQSYWPQEFVKKVVSEDSDEGESVVGKMPPSDSEDGQPED